MRRLASGAPAKENGPVVAGPDASGAAGRRGRPGFVERIPMSRSPVLLLPGLAASLLLLATGLLSAGVTSAEPAPTSAPTPGPAPTPAPAPVPSGPGYLVRKLPLPPDVLPSCMAVRGD